jgi:TRAP-type mannitol/chloroaromatic compound transport system substrate-binding protein
LVNKSAFAKLPPEYQTILNTAIKAVSADLLGENFDGSARAWEIMKAEYPNIKVMIFPEPVLKAMKKATDEVMEGYAAQNAEFKEVYESQQSYMAKARQWTKMSTQYYLQTSEMVEE